MIAWTHTALLDQRFPGRNRHERKRRGFCEGNRLGFQRDQIGVGGHVIRQRTMRGSAKSARAAVNLIALRKRVHVSSHRDHGAGHIAVQDCRELRGECLRHATPQLVIDWVYARRCYLNQHIARARR